MKESPSNYNRIGMTLGQRGRFAEAIEAFERAIEIKPDFAPAFHNLGLAWWRLGKANQAMAAYRRAIELDPSNVEPHCGLGHALAALGRPEESLETMRSAVAAIPGSGKAHYNYGVAAERLLLWDDAADAYRRSIEMNPLRPEAYTKLANLCLFILGKPDEAIESLNAALELDPTDARVRKALDDAIEFVVR